MLKGKKNLYAEGKALREQFKEELNAKKPSGAKRWYKLSEEQNRRLGQIYSTDILMQELADFLKQYDDLIVHYYGESLYVYGHGPREGVRPGKVRNMFTLWKNERKNALWLGFDNRSIRECNALDWLENLGNEAGKNLALLIQDDATLYEFYQEYTKWFAPYGKRLTSWKSEFMTILLSWVKSFVLSMQDEAACSKNIRFNLMGILHRLADELKEYELSYDNEKIVWIPYGVRIREGKETWVLEVDTENFNCIKLRVRNDDSGINRGLNKL